MASHTHDFATVPVILEPDVGQGGVSRDREGVFFAAGKVVLEVRIGGATGEQKLRVLGQESVKGPERQVAQGKSAARFERLQGRPCLWIPWIPCRPNGP